MLCPVPVSVVMSLRLLLAAMRVQHTTGLNKFFTEVKKIKNSLKI